MLVPCCRNPDLKSHRLERETTTVLAAILQLGVVISQSCCRPARQNDEQIAGLMRVENRAYIAAQLALVWSSGRGDLNPEEEVALAAAGAADPSCCAVRRRCGRR